MQATFTGDWKQFDAGLENAKKNVTAFEMPVKNMQRELQRMTTSFDGTKMIRDAKLMSAAIEQIGGVAKLTENEQRRWNGTVQETIAKYHALGQAVPADIKKVSDELGRAVKAADDLKDKAKGPADSMTSMGGIASKIGPMIAGAFTVGAVVSFGKEMIASAGHVADLADRFAVSTDAIQEFQFVADNTGTTVDDMGAAIGKAQKLISENAEDTARTFRELGLSAASLRQQRPEDAFTAIAEAIKGVPNPMDQTRIAMELFGESGSKMLPAIRKGMSDLRQEARDLNVVLDKEAIKALDDFGQKWDNTMAGLKSTTAMAALDIIAAFESIPRAIKDIPKIKLSDMIETMTPTSFSDMLMKGMRIGALPVTGPLELLNLGRGERDKQGLEALQKELQEQFKQTSKRAFGEPAGGGASDSMTAQLNAARKALADLTTEQINQIKAGVELQKTTKEIATAAHTTATVVELFKKQTQDTTRALKDHAEELKKTQAFYKDMAASVDFTTKRMADAERERLKEATEGAKRSADVIVQTTKTKFDAEQNTARILRELTMSELDFKLDAIYREGEARKQMLDLTSELGRQTATAVTAEVDAMMQSIVLRSKEAQEIIALISGMPGMGAAAGFLSDFPGVEDALGGESNQGRRGRVGQDAAAQWAANWRQQNWNWSSAGNSAQSIGNMASMYGPAIEDIISGDTEVLRATNVRGRGNRAAKGALAGASEGGKYGGPYGAAGGAVVGALIGAFRNPAFEDILGRSGRRFGEEMSEELSRAIADIDKARKDWGREESEIFMIGDTIKDIGIDDGNFDKLAGRVRDIYSMVETGKFSIEEANQAFGKSFGALAEHVQKSEGLASKSFQELITLNKRFGLESEAVTEFIKGQTAALGSSVGALAAPLLEQGTGSVDAQKKAMEELGRIERDRGKDSTEYAEQLKVTNDLQLRHAELARGSADEVNRLGLIALASFNAAIEGGGDYLGALEAMGPALDNLLGIQSTLGLSADNPALQELQHLRDLMTMPENATLVSAAAALGPTLQALTSIGGLTTETLAAMEAQGVTTFDRLVAGGFSENQALRQMEGFLANVLEGHEQLGTPIDDNTQRLITMAKEQGLLKRDGKDMADVLKTGFADMKLGTDRLVGSIGLMVRALGADVPEAVQDAIDALARIPRDIDINARVVYDDPGHTPNVGDPSGGDGGGPTHGAAGGIYATGPTATWFGEGGQPELGGPVSFMGDVLTHAINRLGGGRSGASESATHEINIYLNDEVIARAVAKKLPRVLNIHGAGR